MFYIPASGRNGTLYMGATDDPARRAGGHKADAVEGFTRRYKVKRLVYCEPLDDATGAIRRKEQTNAWRRLWKPDPIERTNPRRRNLRH